MRGKGQRAGHVLALTHIEALLLQRRLQLVEVALERRVERMILMGHRGIGAQTIAEEFLLGGDHRIHRVHLHAVLDRLDRVHALPEALRIRVRQLDLGAHRIGHQVAGCDVAFLQPGQDFVVHRIAADLAVGRFFLHGGSVQTDALEGLVLHAGSVEGDRRGIGGRRADRGEAAAQRVAGDHQFVAERDLGLTGQHDRLVVLGSLEAQPLAEIGAPVLAGIGAAECQHVAALTVAVDVGVEAAGVVAAQRRVDADLTELIVGQRPELRSVAALAVVRGVDVARKMRERDVDVLRRGTAHFVPERRAIESLPAQRIEHLTGLMTIWIELRVHPLPLP